LLKSLNESLEVTSWIEYMKMNKPVYKQLCWEFMSSIKVNWNTPYQNLPVQIQSQLFNRTFDPNLANFDRCLKLLHGVWTPTHANFNEQEFWVEITCDKCTK